MIVTSSSPASLWIFHAAVETVARRDRTEPSVDGFPADSRLRACHCPVGTHAGHAGVVHSGSQVLQAKELIPLATFLLPGDENGGADVSGAATANLHEERSLLMSRRCSVQKIRQFLSVAFHLCR